MFKEISPVFKTEMVRCSSSSWPCLSTPYRMSSWSSQMRGQFSSEKQTTICIALALISGLKSSQNFHLACWHQPFLEELFTTWLDSLRQNGTSSLYFVSTYYLRFYFFFLVVILFLIYNASSGYALILGTIFSDKQLAVTLTPVLIIPFMLFAGFFVN